MTPLSRDEYCKRRGNSVLRFIVLAAAYVLLSGAAQAENADRPFKLNVRGGLA